ncbi:protein qua-1 [Cinnamomum micranthum f. kanehirae]|uniref:Protein qua-1 n=1 Tax=Cinnamomum micranthum f. kanehirae TaxID=337451 RepID=A0A3S3NWN7_9MAGN|nr:protein qua-1 [Cinnamomum micranthum f. kanehirae]
MSKEADIKVVKIQTCVLKVYIHCDECKRKVKKLLHKIEGVYEIDIDAEQGKVTVAGNVDPNTLIKKLQKIKKHAELWPSKGGNPQLNKQLQALQIDNGEGPKGGKPQKGGKDLKGQQQQQQQQLLQKIKGLKDMKLPQLKDLKLPTKTQKSVKFNLPEDDGDVTDDGFDDYYDDDDMDDGGFDDDDFDMYPNEVKANLKKAAMNQQNPPMGAPKNGKKGGAGDVQVQNKAMVGNTDAKDGNGGKKGGQSQGGGAGVAKSGGKNGGAQDHKNGGNGGTGNNKVATNGTNGGNNSAASGGKKGGGGGKNDHMGHPMPNNMSHGFHGMNLSGGGANVGQMGNMPMGQMGNIPVQGLPAMNAGGYFQGAGPGFPPGNPYNQQQFIAAMMQQQRQNGMYARPPSYPVPCMPHPSAGESYANLFSDENPNSCMIM